MHVETRRESCWCISPRDVPHRLHFCEIEHHFVHCRGSHCPWQFAAEGFPTDAAWWCTILAENARNAAITGISYCSIMSLMLTLKLGTTMSCASDMILPLEKQQRSCVSNKSVKVHLNLIFSSNANCENDPLVWMQCQVHPHLISDGMNGSMRSPSLLRMQGQLQLRVLTTARSRHSSCWPRIKKLQFIYERQDHPTRETTITSCGTKG